MRSTGSSSILRFCGSRTGDSGAAGGVRGAARGRHGPRPSGPVALVWALHRVFGIHEVSSPNTRGTATRRGRGRRPFVVTPHASTEESGRLQLAEVPGTLRRRQQPRVHVGEHFVMSHRRGAQTRGRWRVRKTLTPAGRQYGASPRSPPSSRAPTACAPLGRTGRRRLGGGLFDFIDRGGATLDGTPLIASSAVDRPLCPLECGNARSTSAFSCR